MPTGRRTPLAALAAATVAVGLGGCGSGDDDSIPKSASDQLIAQLNEMEATVSDGNCALAQGQASRFEDSVRGLPSDVDPEVKGDLTKLADNLVELADSEQCVTTETGATGETGVATTETEPSEPTTEASTTTTTTTEEPAEEQPSDDSGNPTAPGQQDGGPPSSANDNGAGIGGGSSGGIEVDKPKGSQR